MPQHHQETECAFCSGPTGSCGARLQIGGCFANCGVTCDRSTCDWTCPENERYVSRMREVGGALISPVRTLRAPDEELPPYVPMIRHEYKLRQPLLPPVVALPTFQIIKRKGSSYGDHVQGAAALRQRFHLAPETAVLLTSVATDDHLEGYWHARTAHDVPRKLAEMGVSAITTPNFSFFDDAPRIHTLWNRRRLAIVAEELSDAGVGVIPHLNALTQHDWNHWAEVLRAQPQLRMVAKEFQTGLDDGTAGRHAFERLLWLQDKVGRDLHPVLIAGSRFLERLARHFKSFTIVDSVPFMRAMHRHGCRAVGHRNLKLCWEGRTTPPGEPLDSLYEDSLREYQNWVSARISSGRSSASGGSEGYQRRGQPGLAGSEAPTAV